jgi:hypothetical protein
MCRGINYMIQDNGFWDPKMYPHSFKEDIESGLHCDALIACIHNHHLRKAINNHKNTVISLLGGQKARHVFH